MTKKNDRFNLSFLQYKNTYTFLNSQLFSLKKSDLYILSYQSDSNSSTKNLLFDTNLKERQKKWLKKRSFLQSRYKS